MVQQRKTQGIQIYFTSIAFIAIILFIVLENVKFLQENKICWIIIASSVENMAPKL